MRVPLILAALLLSSGVALAADPAFPTGGVFGLVPPPGMTESTQFAGFEDPQTGASILMVDMPPQAYAQVAAGFTDAALAGKGIVIDTRGTLPLALPGVQTLFVTGRQAIGPVMSRKWILVAGTAQGTALVTVQVPEPKADTLSDDSVRQSLETLAYRPPPSVEQQMEGLSFRFTDLSGFRPIKVIGNAAVVLTDGPKDVLDGAEQPIFVAGVAPGAPREDDRRQFAFRAFSNVAGVKEVRIERAEPLRIGAMPGFEILATGQTLSGEDVKIVQWLRFGPTAHVRMVGIVAAKDFAKDYPRLRALRDAMEPR